MHFGGVGTFGSGLPYNVVTGTTNSGDTGATTDRPVINGTVIGRNAGRGNGQYSVDPFLSRAFPLYRDRVTLDLRAEAFNVLNHANFVGYSGTAKGDNLALHRPVRITLTLGSSTEILLWKADQLSRRLPSVRSRASLQPVPPRVLGDRKRSSRCRLQHE
ncbi:MAG: hypothetical protein JWQ49_4490 [Edaphobacter sp.]|nr:hypothetical protein [Edaphobacter sp.]